MENENITPAANNNENNAAPVQQEKKLSAWDVTKLVAKGFIGTAVLGLAVVGGISLVKHFGGSAVTEAAAEAASELL